MLGVVWSFCTELCWVGIEWWDGIAVQKWQWSWILTYFVICIIIFKASQTEEFKNLKASFDTLHQEKEKVDNELANHVALLQQERDSKTKLASEL